VTFHEDWFGEASCAALAALVRQTEGVNGSIIEIGSWEGRSTIALANAAHPEIVHAVDTWEGSPGEISATLAAERDVFATFESNVAALTERNVEVHRMGWREFFADWSGPIRLVFIDAEHTYDEVAANIAAVAPFLEPGGIICGDDAHHPPVAAAVVDAFPDAQTVATLWLWQKPSGTLADRYERVASTPSDIVEHLPRFVDLVRERNATHVIELGTRTGVSTIAWLHALGSTGGRLTSVDIDARPDIGDWLHWTFHQADDLDPALLRLLEPADIVFLDTSHLYDQTVAELHVYRHLVKPGGLIVCHDTELERPEGAPLRPRFPVKTAITEFCADEGFEWSNNPACWGLAEIEVT
jgi:predicted O-methyltransferase YrrM